MGSLARAPTLAKDTAIEPSTTRLNLSNIIAASIVAVGLVSSARILARQPVLSPNAVAVQSAPVANRVSPLAPPPLSQETVRAQVLAQVVAAPDLQTCRYENIVYKLSDPTVAQVSYSAKDDTFSVILNWGWQPAMPKGGPRQTYITLSNNGYNQYVGPVVLSAIYGGTGQSADLCVK